MTDFPEDDCSGCQPLDTLLGAYRQARARAAAAAAAEQAEEDRQAAAAAAAAATADQAEAAAKAAIVAAAKARARAEAEEERLAEQRAKRQRRLEDLPQWGGLQRGKSSFELGGTE